MKPYFFLTVAVATLLSSCLPQSKTAINSKDLAGRYQIDFTPSFDASNDSETRLARLFLSAVDCSVTFYDNGQAVVDYNSALVNFIRAFDENSQFENYVQFDYSISNDSIITFDVKDSQKKSFVLRCMGGAYDYLQIANPETGELVVNLKKIQTKESAN